MIEQTSTTQAPVASLSLMDRVLGLRFLFVPTGTALVVLLSVNLLWPKRSAETAQQPREQSAPAFDLGEADALPSDSHVNSAANPGIPLSECIANNPFDVPESLHSAFAEPAAESVAPPVIELPPPVAEPNAEDKAWRESLLQKRIQVVYQSSHGTVAIVDSRVIRAGDALDNSRVVEIRLDGIVLERVAPVAGASVSLGVAIPLFAPRSNFDAAQFVLRASSNSPAIPQDRAVLPIPNVPLAATAKVTDEAVSIIVRNASVRQVLDLIAEEHGWSVEADTLPEEPFTLSLFDLPLHDVLEVILQPRGLAWARDAERLAISAQPAAELVVIAPSPLVRSFPLKYLSQANVEPVVSSLLSPHGKTHFAESEGDARSEMLVIDEPAAIERVESYLAQADRPPPHVLIEAHVLQVALNAETWQGVNLLPLAAEKNGLPGSEGARHLRFAPDRAASVLPALQVMLGAQSIASPQMLVVNGKQVVTQVHGSGFRIDLQLVPKVAGDGRLWLRISPALSDGQVNPTTGQSDLQASLETTVLLSDGETLVLGGLIHQRELEMMARRRILSELPVIGQRFQYRYSVPMRTEVLIVVTPKIVGETVSASLAAFE